MKNEILKIPVEHGRRLGFTKDSERVLVNYIDLLESEGLEAQGWAMMRECNLEFAIIVQPHRNAFYIMRGVG